MTNKIKPHFSGDFSGSFISTSISKRKVENFSIQMNVVGTVDFDVEIQQSVDGRNFATVAGSALTGQTAAGSPILWDLSTGNPSFYKVVVTINSGSAYFEIFSN